MSMRVAKFAWTFHSTFSLMKYSCQSHLEGYSLYLLYVLFLTILFTRQTKVSLVIFLHLLHGFVQVVEHVDLLFLCPISVILLIRHL